MNIQSAIGPVVTLLLGMLILSIVVSALLVLIYGPKEREVATVYVQRPWYHNYRNWWGPYGAGLPGWGGPKYPPPPAPHPKPPAPVPPPAPPPNPGPVPAQPPPANPSA